MKEPSFTGKEYYIALWNGLLAEFLHWNEAQVNNWATSTGIVGFLDNADDMFYHESPIYWATILLIPEVLQARLSGAELAGLQQRILLAFKDENLYNFTTNTNWKPYKAKVQAILGE